ncbi:hypothetical protein ACVWWI_006516 [Bradyrhizobium sp. USDA 3686]|nr:hypothetical protein [Bradyrhizobium canariense]
MTHGATGNQPEPEAEPKNSSDEDREAISQPNTLIRRHKARSLAMFKEQQRQNYFRDVSSDEHPISINGSKGPWRFVKTLDTAHAKAAPTTISSGSALADTPGPAASTTTPTNASATPADVVRDGLSARSGRANKTVKGTDANRHFLPT